ncbi:MAG: hypothetical protein KGN79_07795 [Acidobacteriota bacterium]|nr:hypothetical protein [Acidobacteriota bacterium]
MNFSFSRVGTLAALLAAGTLPTFAQSTPAQTPTAPQAKPAVKKQTTPHSGDKVIFSRSTDANGEVVTHVGPGAAVPKIEAAAKPEATDAERLALAVTGLDLDVHMDVAAHTLEVRARVQAKNAGATPLKHVALQLSSSLKWEQMRVNGKNMNFSVATLNSDADHTGQLHEAAVTLATPIAPGASVELDTFYSGAIEATAQRLMSLGTPETVAIHNDWDEISPDFTGLRGFGNVVWYPVASIPVVLGDGARLFSEIGRQKLMLSHAHVRVLLTAQFPHDEAPTVAVLCGHAVDLKVEDKQGTNPGFPGVATAELDVPVPGFEAPSIFLARRKAHSDKLATAWATADNDINVEKWLDAASDVRPFLELWLGVHPRGTLTLIDLPDPKDAPFETGTLLVAPLGDQTTEQLDRILVHALTHSFTQMQNDPAPAWLNEGLATFMETLWVEHRKGRDAALGVLEADRPALALVEPSSPGAGNGQPLDKAIDPIYYRTKAAYVYWMLRDMVGDDALSAMLRDYQPQAGESSSATLIKLLRGAGVTRDISWFFDDWVDHDKGLPDLSIAEVFPHPAQSGSVLVAVNVNNTGYAACEVPVTVHTAKGLQAERVFIPARSHAVRRILVLGQPTEVQVNDGTVPEIEASVHKTTIGGANAAPPLPGGSSSSTPPQN